MKKKNNTPTGKIITIEMKNKRREEAEALRRARRTERLKSAGITDEQMKQLIEEKDARSILCMYYGKYIVDLGEKEITKKIRKKRGRIVEVTRKEHTILRGREAAEHYIKEKKLDVILFKPTHCYIKSTAEKAEEIADDLRKEIGRCSITKHDNMTVKDVIEKFHPTPEVPKQPTNNTTEKKKVAKKKRKDENKKQAEMRAFYAAKRKGSVSKRIKKFNKPLAEKIEKWLKEQKVAEASRKKGSKEERAKHKQLSSTEMKANKRARKAVKHLAMVERRKEAEKKRQEVNQKAKDAKVAEIKKKNPKQGKLEMAA